MWLLIIVGVKLTDICVVTRFLPILSPAVCMSARPPACLPAYVSMNGNTIMHVSLCRFIFFQADEKLYDVAIESLMESPVRVTTCAVVDFIKNQ